MAEAASIGPIEAGGVGLARLKQMYAPAMRLSAIGNRVIWMDGILSVHPVWDHPVA